MKHAVRYFTWFGFAALGFFPACGGPPATSVTTDARIIITHYPTNIGNPDVWFIRDKTTNDCWVAVGFPSSTVALATAKPESCTRSEQAKLENR